MVTGVPEECLHLDEDSCAVCADSFVVCLTEDVPTREDAPTDLEIDRKGGKVFLRNIIRDVDEDPLYVEYSLTRELAERISLERSVEVIFVRREGEERHFIVKFSDDDVRAIRREMGMGGTSGKALKDFRS